MWQLLSVNTRRVWASSDKPPPSAAPAAGPCDAPQAPLASEASQAAQVQQSQRGDSCTQGIRRGHRTFSQATMLQHVCAMDASADPSWMFAGVRWHGTPCEDWWQHTVKTKRQGWPWPPLATLFKFCILIPNDKLPCIPVMLRLHTNDHRRASILCPICATALQRQLVM